MTDTLDLGEAVYEHSIDIEKVIHVPTMLASRRTSDMDWAIETGDLDNAAPLLDITPEVLREAAKDDELGWVLRDQKGWLIEVSVATYGPWSEGKYRSRSLHEGVRALRWFAGDSYEAALTAAVEWVESEPPDLLRDYGKAGGEGHHAD